MKLLRISVPLLAFTMAAALAACGGGGGGGSTPPVGNPGGGGGGTPPTPTTAPSSAPTTSPTTSPSSTPVPVSASAVIAVDGSHALGQDNWQTNGVTDPDKGDGDTATGGLGPNAVGPISCAIGNESMVSSTVYHVHAFLGILVNGVQMAIPDAIGMQNPQAGEPITAFTCAYNLHTHAASGVIHVEDPAISGNWNTGVQPPTKYNLQALLDVWGQPLSGLAGGVGMPQIYVGTVTGKSPISGHTTEDYVDAYSLSSAATTNILLQHHVAIWLVYGTFPSAGLPPVDFGISN